ncbi:MAG: hypothetical protein AAGA23_14815 [Pseudomonadota bacterium]
MTTPDRSELDRRAQERAEAGQATTADEQAYTRLFAELRKLPEPLPAESVHAAVLQSVTAARTRQQREGRLVRNLTASLGVVLIGGLGYSAPMIARALSGLPALILFSAALVALAGGVSARLNRSTQDSGLI